MEKNFSLFAAGAAVGALVAGIVLVAGFFALQGQASQNQMIKEYYYSENAVAMSPSDLINILSNGSGAITVVDLRNRADYSSGHLAGAINIPAQELEPAQLVSRFSAMPNDRQLVLYCYSSYCMLARHVGKLLADNGIYARDLTAGWHEIQRDYFSYTVNGTEPGAIPKVDSSNSCSVASPLSC